MQHSSFSRDSAGRGLCRFLLGAAVLVAFLPAARAQQPPKHQATGTVVSATPTRLILLRRFGRNKVRWTFVLTSHGAAPAQLAKGARARVYYHDEKGQHIADRWRILAPPKPSSSISPPPLPGLLPDDFAGGARDRIPREPIDREPNRPAPPIDSRA